MGLVGRKGKLSIKEDATDVRDVAWQRYEDVLTADAFGAYRYLPPSLGILPILEYAIDETEQTFPQFLHRFGIELTDLNVARIRLWPVFEDGREPDVFVLLKSKQHQQSVAMLVEAKLHAPQHEICERSQLGHYLIQHLADAYADDSIAWELPQHPRPLLFITNHKEIPASELARARQEVGDEMSSVTSQEVGLFWVNWATVGLEARRLWRERRDDVDTAPWLRHLLDLYEEIRDRDLLPRPRFSGITGSRFSHLPRSYARSYMKPVSASSFPLPIAARQYTVSSRAGHSSDIHRYSRSFQSHAISLGRIPAIYGQESEESS